MKIIALGLLACSIGSTTLTAGELQPFPKPKSHLQELAPAKTEGLKPVPAASSLKEHDAPCCDLKEWPQLENRRGLIPFEV